MLLGSTMGESVGILVSSVDGIVLGSDDGFNDSTANGVLVGKFDGDLDGLVVIPNVESDGFTHTTIVSAIAFWDAIDI